MSTARAVPPTHDLEGDDALATLARTGWRQLILDSWTRLRAADGFSHARALAFQAILTALPAMIAVVGFAAALDQDEFTRVLQATVEEIAPGPAGDVVDAAFQHGAEAADDAQTALWAGLLLAIFAGAVTMGQLERAANRIYGVERDRPSVRKYAVAAALALTAGLCALAAAVALVLGDALRDAVKRETDAGATVDTLIEVGRWPVGLALLAAAVALLFWIAPRRPQPSPSWLAVGAVPAVLLSALLTVGLARYIDVSRQFGDTYGPFAGLIGCLLWAQLSAIALLLGLAFAAQLEAVRAGDPGPRSPR